jgi:hypothetical protein
MKRYPRTTLRRLLLGITILAIGLAFFTQVQYVSYVSSVEERAVTVTLNPNRGIYEVCLFWRKSPGFYWIQLERRYRDSKTDWSYNGTLHRWSYGDGYETNPLSIWLAVRPDSQ